MYWNPKVERNARGELSAQTDINMKEPGRVLRIYTSKRSGGKLWTTATVGIVAKPRPGSIFKSFRFAMFGDFSKNIAAASARATPKAIEALHRSALEGIDALLIEAEAYCAAKPGDVTRLEAGEEDGREGVLVATDPEADRAKAIAALPLLSSTITIKDDKPINGAAVGMPF